MELSFKNKVVLVTGAAGGIGFATAKAFAESGAKVVLAGRTEEKINAAAERLKSEGYEATAVRCEVSNEADVKALIEKTVEIYGGLDIAYNNVGIHAPVCELAEADGADFDRVIAVNLRGVWNCMKYELIQMKKQGRGGSIVNCSSQGGLVGIAGITAYTASKHGVIGLTKSAALEYAKQGIRINVICPGTTDTPMVSTAAEGAPEHMEKVIAEIPLGRMGKAEEIASMVLWISSDFAGFAIGQVFAIDGGYTTV